MIAPEKFQHIGIGRNCWIKPDFDALCMAFHVVVSRVRGVAPCVPDPGLQHTRSLIEDWLRVPKSPHAKGSRLNRFFVPSALPIQFLRSGGHGSGCVLHGLCTGSMNGSTL
jgi:hypothetical protein